MNMLNEAYLVGIPSLLAIRVVAAVIFAQFYIRTRRPLYLLILSGWVFYALSSVFLLGIARPMLPLPVEVQLVFAAGAGYIGTTLLMLAASCYIHFAILRAVRLIIVLMVLLAVPGFLLTNTTEIVVYFIALQGFSFFLGACVLWFERVAARKHLGRAAYGLGLVVFIGLLQASLMLTGQQFASISMVVNAGTSLILTIVFILAEHNEILEKLRQSSIRLAQAENLAKIGYWERNVVTDRAYWSSGHYKVFGIPEDQPALSSEALLTITHPDDVEGARRVYRRIQQGSPYEHYEFRIILPNGEVRWIKSDTTQKEGVEHWVFGVTQDITERKLVELRLAQAVEENSTQFDRPRR
ncbi:MAG: PAS domain-containing protein [Spirochaeta sp.]|nr:PAS domain-containing protein [Spirochaeta sp.]